MSNSIIYSILQYRYSPVLDESLNIGVLFYFPNEKKKLYFYHTDNSRVKSAYSDIDTRLFNALLRLIKTKTEDYEINKKVSMVDDFDDFIDNNILKRDDSIFQFSKLFKVWNVFHDTNTAINNYLRILLPQPKKNKRINNEYYIVKNIKTKLKELPHHKLDKINFGQSIWFNDFKIKSDFCWKGEKTNFVIILNLDLANETSIQKKVSEYFGYLNYVKEYLYNNNSDIHLLLVKPKRNDLEAVYKKSRNFLSSVNSSPNEFVFIEENADNYVDFLIKNI